METNQSRSPALHPPIAPSSEVVSKDFSFELRRMGLTKSLFFARYFLTKSLRRGQVLESWEENALHLLLLRLESVRDSNFISANFDHWLGVQNVSRIWREKTAETSYGRKSIALLHKNLNLFLSPRAFLGQEKPSREMVLRTINRSLRKSPTPLRRIGVGYRDKGNARQRHQDGSPSWEEVVAGKPDGG